MPLRRSFATRAWPPALCAFFVCVGCAGVDEPTSNLKEAGADAADDTDGTKDAHPHDATGDADASPDEPECVVLPRQFLREVVASGLRVTLRRSRGSDIQAACGQLALRGDA